MVGDSANHRIRKVTPAGEVSTVATIGCVTKPWGITIGKGGILYVTDSATHNVFRWSEPVQP